LANLCGIIFGMVESEGLTHLRQLAARKRRLDTEIDEQVEALLREGEFVNDIADALGVSRETVRRFRDARGIPDARETRRAMGAPARRSS
jgi:DNA invertase Pin-like site-specific DNA recombinase